MDGPDINALLCDEEAVRSKGNVIAALYAALQPGGRREGIRRFVNYYFAFEKKRDTLTLTREDMAVVWAKCHKAMQQRCVISPPRVKKLHTSNCLKEMTVIHGGKEVHDEGSFGTRGWVNGWLTTRSKNAHVDLRLDAPMFVTRMMVHAVNVKASPRSMELLGWDEEKEDWVLVRAFRFRDRDYEGSHGQHDYNKCEMFYVLGRASNQEEYDNDCWEVHPLAGPGQVCSDEPDLYMCAKDWRWRIIDSNGAGYIGFNNFSLYGREAVLPAPENVKAQVHATSAQITWERQSDVEVDRFHVVAYPGGFGQHANGGFYEQCSGSESGCFFPKLSPGVAYQFQVIAIDADGREGMPSKASNTITIPKEGPEGKSGIVEDLSIDEGSSEDDIQDIEYEPLDGAGYETVVVEEEVIEEYPDMMTAFNEMIKGKFAVVEQLTVTNKVTLYVSGCLEDTNVERKYISKYAIPKLEWWCNANGYDFSGTDLRWGLASEIADDHKTFAIHMQELERAYKNSSLTIFYFISGERYGSVLLPSVISKRDRDAVRDELKDSMKWIMDDAYYLDKNGDPPVYNLRSIPQIEARQHQFFDDSNLRGVHSLLREIMNVMMRSNNVSPELKQWEPSLAMAECAYALEATRKSHPRNLRIV